MIASSEIAHEIAELLAVHGHERDVGRGATLASDLAQLADCVGCAKSTLRLLHEEARMPSWKRVKEAYNTERDSVDHAQHQDVTETQRSVSEAETWWHTVGYGVIRRVSGLPNFQSSWIAARMWSSVTADGTPTVHMDAGEVSSEIEFAPAWTSSVPSVLTDQDVERHWDFARAVNTKPPIAMSDQEWKELVG